jgi:hypothetical protein
MGTHSAKPSNEELVVTFATAAKDYTQALREGDPEKANRRPSRWSQVQKK